MRSHIFQTMIEENKQQPKPEQGTLLGQQPPTLSFQAFISIENFIPDDFRGNFTDFDYRISIYGDLIPQVSVRDAIQSRHQHHASSLQNQARSPYSRPWSNTIKEPLPAWTEDEPCDVVMSEFPAWLGYQLDWAAQRLIEQYDHTAAADNIAAFESEFLNLLIEVDSPLRKVTQQLREQCVISPENEILGGFRKLNELPSPALEEVSPWQLGLLEYLGLVVGLHAISSPKQQQRDTNRCRKGYEKS